MPLAAGTSYIELLNLDAPWSPEDNLTLVVTSGAGGTGVMAVQEALALGAKHVITAASPNHAEQLRALGAERVVDYHNHRTMYDALPDDSVDLVFDNYGYGFETAKRILLHLIANANS